MSERCTMRCPGMKLPNDAGTPLSSPIVAATCGSSASITNLTVTVYLISRKSFCRAPTSTTMLSCRLQVHAGVALSRAPRITRPNLKLWCVASVTSARSMPDHVVICGGEIIGVATAYYLTLQGVKPIVIEKRGIACAASGISLSLLYYSFPPCFNTSDKGFTK